MHFSIRSIATYPSRIVAWLTVAVLCGCRGDHPQSSLQPAGPAAEAIADLWWIMLIVLGTYTLVVFLLTAVAIFKRPRSVSSSTPYHNEGRKFILIGGAVLPALILAPTLAITVPTTSALRMKETGLTVQVTGHRWWWEVSYPNEAFKIANEVVIPVGEPVRIELISADVIHSFWIPSLHGKMDMVPGKTNLFWIQADQPGMYRGQCAEYCGTQHALMAFVVKALEPNEFVQWLQDKQSAESLTPDGLETNAVPIGFKLFLQHGCAACHAIQGTSAQGWAGPDLTYLAERETLAAGTIRNNSQNLLRWLENPQRIKPGVNMPATVARHDQLEAIVDYLLEPRPASETDGGRND